jgi:cytochrome P450
VQEARDAAWLLAAHPDQRARLRADPTLLGNAVEEILRIEAPVHGLARTLTRDVELHGHTMSEGQKVLLLFGSGNRDEREFDAPDHFDVTRQFDSHLSFGFGIHYCIGIHLGRLEGRVGIETLLTRLGDYELASDTVHWRQAIPTRPMTELPIVFAPRSANSSRTSSYEGNNALRRPISRTRAGLLPS